MGSPCSLGRAEVSFGKKRWDERMVADESWDLSAKPHPALETVLKSQGQQAHRPTGVSPEEMPVGAQVGPRLENPALGSSPLGHPAHCYHLTFD